jgi:hypothetical protein
MPLGIIAKPILDGLPSWLLSIHAVLEEELERSPHWSIHEVYVRATAFSLILSPSTARHVHITLCLAMIRASVAAVYHDIEAEEARGLTRLAQGRGNARRIQVHVRFDREANLTRMLDLSPIALLTQDC